MGRQMSPESIEALNVLAADKGIDMETLLAALADAIETGYKSQHDANEEAWIIIDPNQMEIKVMSQVLSEDDEPTGEEKDITPEDFGRIATQAMRQVLTQEIREVEWEQRYEEYAGREGEVVTGIVKQSDTRFTLLDLGSVEALLPPSEQVPYERPENGTRLKAYIVEVRHTSKGPQVVVSRTHPGLIKRLFEMEVPEIAEGIVEILACAREPGHRTKIAVYSHDANIDPVGSCVGSGGKRVRPIVNELMGEKIDIVPYANDPVVFVSSALSPAKVRDVIIDEDQNLAEVLVPDQQLSLAIGREGQNARLAARLTGYIIDIKDAGEPEAKKEPETGKEPEAKADEGVTEDTEKQEGEKDGEEEVKDEAKDSESQTPQDDAPEEDASDVTSENKEAAAEGEDWAGGEWVADPETGEQAFHPADGSDPINAAEWGKLAAETNEAGNNVTESNDTPS